MNTFSEVKPEKSTGDRKPLCSRYLTGALAELVSGLSPKRDS